MTKVTIVGLAGRVGKDSDNTAILKAALELLPENMELEIIDEEGVEQLEPDTLKWGAHSAILFDERDIAIPENAPGQDATSPPRVILSLHKIDMPEKSAVIARKKNYLNGPIANPKATELIKSLLTEFNSKQIA